MKKYNRPSAEFIVLANNHIVMASSCDPYNCPNMYGSTCSGHCYTNTAPPPSDCPDDIFVDED